MRLVKVAEAKPEDENTLRIDPEVARNMGVRVEPVQRRPLAAGLRLDGEVAAEENRIYSAAARTMSYAEVVRVQATGQRVARGDVLAEFYSTEVLFGQERLHQARDRRMGVGETVELARQRLLNWGLPVSFIDSVLKSKEPLRLFPVLAPASGIVVQKKVVQGQPVSAGEELFRIVDLSEVWVRAHVYQHDLAWVRIGSPARIRFPNLPGRAFESEVFFVSSEMDPGTRTAEIRMKLRNTPAWDLRPEMFAEVSLEYKASEAVLTVPAQALIRTGARSLVVRALGEGRYRVDEVRTGREAGGWVEVLEGVREGDPIVASAQFLIDSESNLRAVVAQMNNSPDRMDAHAP
jgi:multidrug efflux pump subunit AcrA (membrane-fusion protein)